MDFVTIFFLLACFISLRIVWQDVKDLMVNESLSYYMFGATAVIFLAMNYIFLWIILTLITSFALAYLNQKSFMKKQNFIGEGDITILSWVIPSLFVLSWTYGFAFLIIYSVANVGIATFMKKGLKDNYPGTIAIAIGLILTWFMQLSLLI